MVHRVRPEPTVIGYRRDIDGLRALAIGSVLLAHAEIPFARGGFVGVDVFFVISGYLITRIILRGLETGSFSIFRFYENLARRLVPALLVVLLVTFILAAFALGPRQFDFFARSAMSAAAFVSNIWFWQAGSGYFDGDLRVAILLHTWSLGVEEQFYLIVPLLLCLVFRLAPRLLLSLLLLSVLASFCRATYLVSDFRAQAAFFLLPSRVWELGVGALLAVAPPEAPARGAVRAGIAQLALAAILIPVVFYSETTPFPGAMALPPVLGAAALIWINASGDNPVKRLMSTPLLVGIGLMSYSFYLWHWPVIVFARIYLGAMAHRRILTAGQRRP